MRQKKTERIKNDLQRYIKAREFFFFVDPHLKHPNCFFSTLHDRSGTHLVSPARPSPAAHASSWAPISATTPAVIAKHPSLPPVPAPSRYQRPIFSRSRHVPPGAHPSQKNKKKNCALFPRRPSFYSTHSPLAQTSQPDCLPAATFSRIPQPLPQPSHQPSSPCRHLLAVTAPPLPRAATLVCLFWAARSLTLEYR